MRDPRTIRDEILSLTEEYYQAQFSRTKPFQPGDRISYAGRVFDQEELRTLVDASLEFWLTAGRFTQRFEAELADYLGKALLAQLERSVQSGQQYRADAAYIQRSMEDFNRQVDTLRTAMAEIASSISGISDAVDGAVSGVTGVSGSTRALAGDMAGITAGMDTNQEIVGELRRQVDVLANL